MSERRLTVLNIVEDGRYGGPLQRIAEVGATLRSDYGVETVVLLPAAGSERFRDVLGRAGIAWRAIPLHRLTKEAWHLVSYALLFVPEVLAIRSVIRSVKPDVVHCNGSWQVKGVVAAWMAGIPRVWHMNDSFMPALVHAFFDVVYRVCPPTAVVSSCRRTVRYYFGDGRRPPPSKIWVIPPPVDTDRFDPARDYPNPYPDPAFEGTRILSVGNVVPVKDYELLIRLAHEMNARGRGAGLRFYVAGTVLENHRTYYEWLRAVSTQLSVENVVFLGAREDVPAFVRHAHVFICTSQSEAGPMALWEALSMGKPALSTDVGDVRELFEEHRCGLVANGRDPRELADLLERLITRTEEAAEMGRNGRMAAEQLDVGHAAAKHAECYREVVGCWDQAVRQSSPRSLS